MVVVNCRSLIYLICISGFKILHFPFEHESQNDTAFHSRTMLFLQGHPSFFWRDLARALADDGHRILKVNFCLSDHFFWRLRGAKSYRGTLKNGLSG